VPVYLVRGDDSSLVREAVIALVDRLVGDGDRSLMVEELAGDDYELATLVDAAQTPPFLTERRVVVGRDAHRFSTADAVGPLVGYLRDPLPTTDLVLVWESGRLPKALADAIARRGQEIDTSPGRNQRGWLDAQLRESGLHLDAGAKARVLNQVGEDLGRVGGLLRTLASAYGPGARLTEDDVEAYLGEAGGVAPWDLTDAIDEGRIAAALERLHRMLGPGDLHPLQVMARLHGHYARMLRLDGADVTSDREAAQLLGMNPFPAGKARRQAAKLGSDRIAQAIGLLAGADLDLRGLKDWPPDLVMEVVVARLANLSRR
jgi:DNA polymerase-3 subunit delta